MKDTRKFIFSGEPQRVDAFLALQLDGYSRVLVKEFIKKGAVLVNGVPCRPSLLLAEGDNVEIVIDKPKSSAKKLDGMIVFEDKHILVINKPDGLLVHPLSPSWENNPDAVFAGEETLASILISCRPEIAEAGVSRTGIVHRLDRETSGLMVVAKTCEAQDSLLDQFQNRQVEKIYNCVSCGEIKEDLGRIDVPIGRMAGQKIKASPIGRESLTEYKVVERKNGYTLVELTPKTGRTNQLRVHMSWLGYPVLGDWLYGGEKASRLMLHARQLRFSHPFRNRNTEFEAPWPENFASEWARVSGTSSAKKAKARTKK